MFLRSGPEISPVVGWQAGRDPNDPNSGTAAEQTLAKASLATLLEHYPGWSWFVEVRDGLLMIKNFELDWRGTYCMVRRVKDVHHDAGIAAREVKMAAGEFLERAAQKRAAYEGARVTAIEGAEEWRPNPC